MATKGTVRIEGQGKVILVLEQCDFSALNVLLFEVSQEPEKISEMSRAYGLGLGGNHIEALSKLWRKIHEVPDKS